MRVAFCSSEVVPFSKTGGLADVAGALPQALGKEGVEVKVFTPLYRGIKPEKTNEEFARSSLGKNIEAVFIKNDSFFDRDNLYGTPEGDYPDNLDRFDFYCKKTLELCKKMNFRPDIIHCNDWQAGLIPVYLKHSFSGDSFYQRTKTVFTVHNLAYQGLFDASLYGKLGLPGHLFSIDGLEFYEKISLLKGALLFSDIITTVSPTYAKEIQTQEFGCGLEGVLKKRSDSLFGILNGLDYTIWNPKTDKLIYKKYDSSNIARLKSVNKTYLQKEYGLKEDKDVFVLGLVGRLAEQKGIDILSRIIPRIIKELKTQIIILGTGNKKYHEILEKMFKKYNRDKKHKKMFSLYLTFNNTMAHRIYAGVDCFLMPSRYEPCGLGQMISLKYGTLPIVQSTGGLADTISDYTEDRKNGNGFVFNKPTSSGLFGAIRRAHDVFVNKREWVSLVKKSTGYSFSWKKSAKAYCELYKRCLSLQ